MKNVAIHSQPLMMSVPNGAATSDLFVEALPMASIAPPVIVERPAAASRLLDLTISSLVLVFVLPLMAVCALAIALTSRGPVIFRHTRIGRGGREFACLKFRTMSHCATDLLDTVLVDDAAAQREWAAYCKLRHDPRVTPVGRIIRRYSLDELPQLFNVFRGDMSIVGPRPIVTEEVRRYGAFYKDYCSVNPGITGLWQVSGRHKLSYNERVQLDSEYAAHKSLRLDLLILMKTVPVVFFGQNE